MSAIKFRKFLLLYKIEYKVVFITRIDCLDVRINVHVNIICYEIQQTDGHFSLIL